jgi:ribosomal protein S18 acetylase RimI-like enzyme
MTYALLANIVWHSLAGAHASYASGTEGARRYARGLSPIMGFANPERADFSAMEPFCDVGEHLYCAGWSGLVPSGWQIDVDSVSHQMVWDGAWPAIDDELCAVRLVAEHVPQMLQLTALTQPGPFAEKTVELGEYYGVFEGERLVAMAGERFQAGTLREVSGVCTHPDFQGRGLARRLVEMLVRIELARNEIPCLHVMVDNHLARRLYQRMGFRRIQDCVVRVVSRT